MADLVVVHAGNRVDTVDRVTPRFPAEREGSVYRRLYLLLLDLQPAKVVSAAASGSDLIMLRVAEDLNIPTHIALPLPVEEFRRRSVADHGPKWVEAFERALSRAHRVITTDLSEHDDWFLRGNDFILDVARHDAEGDGGTGREGGTGRDGGPGGEDLEVLAVVVSRHDSSDDSVTADFARKTEQRGWPIYVIDPLANGTRPPGSG